MVVIFPIPATAPDVSRDFPETCHDGRHCELGDQEWCLARYWSESQPSVWVGVLGTFYQNSSFSVRWNHLVLFSSVKLAPRLLSYPDRFTPLIRAISPHLPCSTPPTAAFYAGLTRWYDPGKYGTRSRGWENLWSSHIPSSFSYYWYR